VKVGTRRRPAQLFAATPNFLLLSRAAIARRVCTTAVGISRLIESMPCSNHGKRANSG